MSGFSGGGGSAGGGSFGGSGFGGGGGGSFGSGGSSFGGGGGSFGSGSSSFGGGGGSFGKASGGAVVAWDESATGVACARLRDGVARLDAALQALRSAPDLIVTPAPGIDAATLRSCGTEILHRTHEVQRIRTDLDQLHDVTMLVGRAYEVASEEVRALIEEAAGAIAYSAGRLASSAIIAALATVPAWAPTALAAAGIGIGAAVAVGLVAVPILARLALADPERAEELLEAGGATFRGMLEHAGQVWEQVGESLLATPEFRVALSIVLESIDDALLGFAHVSPAVVEGLGERAEDEVVFGFLASAAAVGVSAAAGFRGTVSVSHLRRLPYSRVPVTSPLSAMSRIDSATSPVTIYAYPRPDGRTHYQVFVRGTESWAPDDETGVDGLANLENAASTPDALRGSDAAVADAMRAAGVGSDDTVDLFGYSQGGAAVANVAASEQFNVRAMLVVGAPIGGVVVPEHIDVLSVAHEADLTSATDGMNDGNIRTTFLPSTGSGERGIEAEHRSDNYLRTLEVHRDDMMLDAFSARLRRGLDQAQEGEGIAVEIVRR